MIADYQWLLPAILCGLIALIGNVILGQQVIKRQVVFIDLAVAQVAALGSVLSQLLFNSHSMIVDSWLGHMLGPWLLAILFCLLVAVLEKYWKKQLEAFIGSLYVVAASLAMIIVSKDPHGAEFLQSTLNGQLLWATWEDVFYLGIITTLMLGLIFFRPVLMNGRGFYLIFAILMPVTVKLTGIYLEFALLVIPALCAVSYKDKAALWISTGLGCMGLLSGLMASAVFDIPSGASIVIALFLYGLFFSLIKEVCRR